MASARRIFVALVLCAACSGKSTFVPAPADAGPVGAAPADAAPPDAETPDADPGDAGMEPRACAARQYSSKRYPLGVVFVVPATAATSTALKDDGRTRYEATRDALLTFFELADPRSPVGLIVNPSGGVCDAVDELAPAPVDDAGHREELAVVLDRARPTGEASALAAFRHALTRAKALPDTARNLVVLLLDGPVLHDDSCQEDAGLIDALATDIAAARNDSLVVTLVVAAPASGAGELAGAIAERSGCFDCFADYSGETSFAEPLLELLTPIDNVDYTCQLFAPDPPPGATLDPATVVVTIAIDGAEAEAVPLRTTCDDGPGFTLDGSETLELCPETCERVIEALSTTVTVSASCHP